MDIRSMVNSEDTPSPRRSSTSTPAKPDYRPSPTRLPNVYEAQAPAHDARRDIRPPQPSPLQTQGQNDFTFRNGSAYPNTQSSYQQNPSPGLRGGHISPIQILNQSPSHGHQTPQYSQRESCPGSAHPTNRSFSHSTPLSQTPTASTPGSANGYATFQRPSSSHSITTPISTQHPPSFLQEYPQPAHHQLRTSSQSHNGPQYMSQPSTPLGPPSINARSNLNIHRGSPGEYDQQRTLSGGSHGQLQATTPLSLTARSPQDYRDQHSLSSISGHRNLREPERSESVSPRTRLPSLPQVGSIESFSNQAHPQYGPVTPAKRKAEWDEAGSHNVPSQLNRTPSLATSIGVNGLFNAKHLVDTTQRVFREQTTQSLLKHGIESEARLSAKTPTSQAKPMYQPHLDNNLSSIPLPAISRNNAAQLNTSLHQTSQSSVPPRTATKSPLQRSDVAPSPIKSELSTLNESSGYSPSQPANEMARATKSKKNEPHQVLKADSSEEGMGTSSQPAREKPRLKQPASESMPPTVQKSEAETSPPSSASILKPRKRTPRVLRIAKWQEIPVYAQSVKGTRRTEELFMLSQQRAATGQGVPPPIQIAEKNPSHIPGQKNGTQGTNDQNVPRNNVHVLMDQPAFGNNGPLGHWEPSMLGVEPAEELPTIIMDFLYQQIMSRRDVGVGPAGGAAKLGAIFEIEAKIGQLIDQNTNERLVLPVLNECVVNHNSNLRVKFQSSMTEAQHRLFNQFLNKALVDSQPPKPDQPPREKPRIPMTYKHTYETDTFYELSQSDILQLPHSIRSTIQGDRRSKAKVRITTDQRNGNVIAKIIKARVADIEIYSPRTPFDWRVSVSVEMNYEGDIELERKDGRKADRNKDRMSYQHLAYQFDLTQVTPAEPAFKTEKEHELEVEVSSAEVRRQCQLVQRGEPNGYRELIRSFVDNVRVLARHCQQ